MIIIMAAMILAVIAIFSSSRFIGLAVSVLIAASLILWLCQDIRFAVFVYFLRFFGNMPVIKFSKMVDYIKPVIAIPVIIAELTALAFKIAEIIKFKKSK